jgi:hypothetical protein
MHVFHVVSTWFGYLGILAALLGATIKTFWPERKDRP